MCVRSRTPASPGVPACSTSSSSVAACDSASGSCAVAITSRSLTLSVIRRAEPASCTCSDAGCSRSAAISGSAIASARSSTNLVWRLTGADRVRAGEDATPRPWARSPSACGSLLLRCRRAATSSESIPSSSNSRRARLGPSPGSARHLDQSRRELRAQLDQRGNLARLGERDDLLLDDRADPWQLGRAALAGERR